MKSIVEKGLVGLANAGVIDGGNWFVGHFGAEVLALVFILENKSVDVAAEPLVHERIDSVFTAHQGFFETPIPAPAKEKCLGLKDFEVKVEQCLSSFCVDGHHAIYAALALRALSTFPELARPEIIDGLSRLLDACQKAGFDRFYRLDHDSFQDKKRLQKYTFANPKEAAEAICFEHSNVITDRKVDGDFYFFSGSRLHLITHAQALLDLHNIGYTQIAEAGLPGLTKHCICIDASATPEGAEPYNVQQVHDPRRPEFWQRGKVNPHQGKLAYAAMDIFANSPHLAKKDILRDLSAYWNYYG